MEKPIAPEVLHPENLHTGINNALGVIEDPEAK
jgi:hypothetical protein